jgi:Cys-tRNA(Pro)/Cys-tRNA(Cys) deacylase
MNALQQLAKMKKGCIVQREYRLFRQGTRGKAQQLKNRLKRFTLLAKPSLLGPVVFEARGRCTAASPRIAVAMKGPRLVQHPAHHWRPGSQWRPCQPTLQKLPPSMVYSKIIQLLEQSGAAYQVHAHPSVTTIEDARRTVPHLTRNLLKTVVFKIKDANWILAAVNGNDRIHYKKLADALHVKRTKLRSIAPAQVESELGFEVGGVGPFPVRNDIRVVFDARVAQLGRVFCGSGTNERTVEIEITDLMEIANGRVYPISK